jgi:hypothetical protein
MSGDEPQFSHLGLEFGLTDPVVDGGEFAQHLLDRSAGVPVEVGAHPGAQVFGLADIEHLTPPIPEQVHTGAPGESVGECDLAVVGLAACGGECEEIVEVGDPEGSGALEETPQDVGGGGGVLEGAVGRGDRRAEVSGEGAEAEIARLSPEQATRQSQGVDGPIGEPSVPVRHRGGVEKAEVVPDVVPHDHRIADELKQCGDRLGDLGGAEEHGVGDPGHDGDEGGDGESGVDQRVELPPGLTAEEADGADLGDAEVGGGASRRLDVEDAERHPGERRSQVFERSLQRERHRPPPKGSRS